MKNTRDIKNIRSRHNELVLEKLKKGESLSQHSSMSSWFPPRPVIKKNIGDLNKLYNGKITLKPKSNLLKLTRIIK